METEFINRKKASNAYENSVNWNHFNRETTTIMTTDSITNNNKLDKIANNNNVTTNNLFSNCQTNDKTKYDKQTDNCEDFENRKSLILLASIFLSSLVAMIYIYNFFPNLDESEKENLKIPFDIEDAKNVARVLDRYKDMYYFEVFGGIVLVYVLYFSLISLQTFAIPGSLFLSILSGFLFKFPVALALTCFCSALGATLCYLLSQLVGRRLVRHYFPKKANEWSKQVEKHRDDILSYMLFLRMTPFLPNWFINLVAPVIGVPLVPFALGTFFGVAPPSFIAIQAGKTLYKMTSSSDAFSWGSVTLLGVFSIIALVPVIFKRYFKSKID